MSKIRYGFIGCGDFAGKHLKDIERIEDIEVVALSDLHIENCEATKKQFNLVNATCYDDYNEMLLKEDIDVVTVVTSDRAHRDATVAALKAGKHVICEKPMSLFVEDCVDMVNTADETGNHLLVGQVCRYCPTFSKAKDLLDQGVIGELYYVESEYAHDYEGLEGVDGWRTDPEREAIIGGACHAIDLLRWYAGNPTETTAYSNHKNLKDWPINDTTVAIFRFPNDVIGKVFTSIGCKRGYTMRTLLYGTKGTIIVDNRTPEITIFLDKIESAPFAGGQLDGLREEKVIKHVIPWDATNHNVYEEHRAMVAAIRENKPFVTTGREGARTVSVCRAVVESAKTGKPVEINYPV